MYKFYLYSSKKLNKISTLYVVAIVLLFNKLNLLRQNLKINDTRWVCKFYRMQLRIFKTIMLIR